MRKPIIAGNWKMFKTRDEAINFILQVNNKVPSIDQVDSVICAQFTVLRCLVKRQLENLRIGAQNMHFADEGAYTGEVSGLMLKSIGVSSYNLATTLLTNPQVSSAIWLVAVLPVPIAQIGSYAITILATCSLVKPSKSFTN